jgi:hypothetical protein
MTTTTILTDEVFTGAGVSATMIPESDIYFEGCDLLADFTTVDLIDAVEGVAMTLVTNLYQGCMAKIVNATSASFNGTYMIKSNTGNTITFAEDIGDAVDDDIDITIMSFGAPSPAPNVITGKPTLLADNWLGLVNTLTPPNVEVEVAQVSLALGGSRNLGYQYKKGETVSGGSLDISMGNGSWLYYALGSYNVTNGTSGGGTAHSLGSAGSLSGTGVAITSSVTNYTDRLVRTIGGKEYPPSSDVTKLQQVTENTGGYYLYDFTENNGDALPSFALEVTYEKSGLGANDYFVGSEGTSPANDSPNSTRPFKDIYARVFTGCQVNSLTMNFDEGQELKANLDLVTRRAFDAPVDYNPRRNQRTNDSSATGLFNYHADDTNIRPYLFSGGQIKLYGQTVARVKSGSVAINNNITPQRFIGQSSRQIMSAHIPAQRTYDINLSLLVTDTTIWDELRKDGESNGDGQQLTLKFAKDMDNSTVDDYIELKFEDYITQSVTVPLPDDKGPVQVDVVLSARKLADAKYQGDWKILQSASGI